MKVERPGDVIRRARVEQGYTQAQLAERVGCHARTINEIERRSRESRGRWVTIIRCLQVLGYEVRVTRNGGA